MCRMAVMLSERYITDRFLPDKAIDLIDEACSDVNLHNKNIERSCRDRKGDARISTRSASCLLERARRATSDL